MSSPGAGAGPINLVVYGNSIGKGFNSTNFDALSFASLLRDTLPPDSIFHNTCVQGEFTLGQLTGLPPATEFLGCSWVEKEVDAYYVPGMKNVLLYWEGHNDLAVGVSAVDGIEHVRSICRGRRNQGWRVFTPTLAPIARLDPAITDAYNVLLKAQWQDFSDGIVLLDEDPNVGVTTNPVYYWGDTIPEYQAHPTDAGHAVIFDLCLPVLRRVMAMPALEPMKQFEFSLPSLANRWGTQHRKVAGAWFDEWKRGIDLVGGTGAPAVSMLAGLPSWQFDGVNDQLRAYGNPSKFRLRLGSTAFALFMVVELDAAGSYPTLFSMAPSNNELRCVADTGKPEIVSNAQTVTSPTTILGAPRKVHLLEYLATKEVGGAGHVTIELFVDGVSKGSRVDATGGIIDEIEMYIGSRTSSFYAAMNVGEIVLCAGIGGGVHIVTPTERKNVEEALMTKWSITA